MNYILKVESRNIDKVVLKLVHHGDDVKIKNILRSNGTIYVKTEIIELVKLIEEIIEVKKEKFFPQLLIF